jgi:hypothetical protein
MPLVLRKPNRLYNISCAACRSNEHRGHANDYLEPVKGRIVGCQKALGSPVQDSAYAEPPCSPARRC